MLNPRLQVPPQKVFGPSKPTPNTFLEGTWAALEKTVVGVILQMPAGVAGVVRVL